MNSRAIHVETVNSLTADSFLNAFRRFIARRGQVRQLRSDQGTNFVGGRNLLQTAFFEMDQDKLRAGLRQHDCELVQFEMNVPHASHMGGSWERMIKSVRAALDDVLETHGRQTCLDDELLRTFLTEAEAIVNSRPITYFSMDASETHDPQPLSPMLLLTQKGSVVLPPPGAFRREDLYCRQRWRAVQFMADDFWRRWRVEFLPAMQTWAPPPLRTYSTYTVRSAISDSEIWYVHYVLLKGLKREFVPQTLRQHLQK